MSEHPNTSILTNYTRALNKQDISETHLKEAEGDKMILTRMTIKTMMMSMIIIMFKLLMKDSEGNILYGSLSSIKTIQVKSTSSWVPHHF